jgi:hypothetical protein
MDRVGKLIEQLAATPAGPDMVNPWRDEDPQLDVPGAAALRRANLAAYFKLLAARPPRLLIVGEAPSQRGCRFSGVIFTSEYTMTTHPFFRGGLFVRTSRQAKPWREASSTIVWETMSLLERPAVLWAAVPFQPHQPGVPLSIRTPTRLEQESCLRFLAALRQLFPETLVVAAGRIAERSLKALNVPSLYVHHPSHGGKAAFQAGVLEAERRAHSTQRRRDTERKSS